MSEISSDIRERLASQFPGEIYFEALRLLEALDFEQRVLRSIVFLGAGDLEALRRFARCAEQDWRDVVFWAEYEDHDSERPRWVRSMADPFTDS